MTQPIITHRFRDRDYYFHDTVQAPDLIKEIFSDNYEVMKAVEGGTLSFSPSDVILDLGANEGMFSIYMAGLFPQTRIVSLEPVPRTFYHLQANIKLNGCKNIEAYNVGVGKKGQHTVKMVINKVDASGGSSSLITYDPKGHDQIEVGLVSLDEAFDLYLIERVKLLKIDVEGMEYDILYHTTMLPRVDYMVCEIHMNRKLEFESRRMDALAVWISNQTKLLHADCIRMSE